MDLGLILKRIHDRIEAKANHNVRRMDLTFSQHHVLMYLMHHGGEASYKELEKAFSVAQPTMAGIISRLDMKGFVLSRQNPKDRRLKMAALTEKGKEVCLASMEDLRRSEETMTKGFTEEEKAQLIEYLERVRKNLSEEYSTEEETCSKHS